MKLEFLSFEFDKFASEMQNLKEKKHFDYLVTIVGEDFGADEGLGCVYILENTETHERCSVKMLAKVVDGESVIPTVVHIWKVADLLEREVYDFFGILFLGHPDMRRLFLRSDFKGFPFRKDWKFNDEYTLDDDVEPSYGMEYWLDQDGHLCLSKTRCSLMMIMSSTSVLSILPHTECCVCRLFSTVRPLSEFIHIWVISIVASRRCARAILTRKPSL